MSFQCIVVDDEALGRDILTGYIKDLPNWSVAHEFSDCLPIQRYLDQHPIDLILLDINMPKISGIQFLAGLKNAPATIFTTAYAEHAVTAFELEAFDYLVKPISFDRFHRSLMRVERHLAHRNLELPALRIKEGKRLYKVDTHEVHAIQAYGDYVRIHTDDKIYITKSKLGEFCAGLSTDFCQSHRSWIVNFRSVSYLEGNHLRVGELMIPISAKYRDDVLRVLG